VTGSRLHIGWAVKDRAFRHEIPPGTTEAPDRLVEGWTWERPCSSRQVRVRAYMDGSAGLSALRAVIPKGTWNE